MKIMLLCTTEGTIRNFRRDLISFLQAKGHEVIVVADFLSDRDFQFKTYGIRMQNRSVSIFEGLNYYKAVKSVVKEERPDVVMTFMVKPNTLGVLAAKSAYKKVRIFSMVEGMGVVYTDNSLKYRLIRLITNFLYRRAFKKVDGLFCLNQYDADYFTKGKYIAESKVHNIRGIGVDLNRYPFSEVKVFNRFVFIARMLKEKGVEEFCKAAAIVKEEFPNAEFVMYGKGEPATEECIAEYQKRGVVQYMGITSNIVEVFQDATALVATTYREGSSRVIMEAMACGRAVIASDTIGCNHLVDDGVTGYLVKVKDVEGFAEAMKKVLNDKEQASAMGKKAREKAERECDENKINALICNIVEGK